MIPNPIWFAFVFAVVSALISRQTRIGISSDLIFQFLFLKTDQVCLQHVFVQWIMEKCARLWAVNIIVIERKNPKRLRTTNIIYENNYYLNILVIPCVCVSSSIEQWNIVNSKFEVERIMARVHWHFEMFSTCFCLVGFWSQIWAKSSFNPYSCVSWNHFKGNFSHRIRWSAHAK